MAATSLVLLAGASFGGHVLPRPYGSYVPTSGAGPKLREERIKAEAAGPGCTLVLGDSRVAFHLNSRTIFSPGCEVRNYGFPGVSLHSLVETIDTIIADHGLPSLVVIGIAEGLFQHRIESSSPIERSDTLRWAYLGQQRTLRMIEGLTLGLTPPSDGWIWDENLGRWVSSSIADRVLAALPSRTKETRDMARSYFVDSRLSADYAATLVHIIDHFRARGSKVALMLMPTIPGFDLAAETVAPGIMSSFLESIRRVAADAQVAIIDCAARCGFDEKHFADPIHLNAGGAAYFTEVVGRKLHELRIEDAGKANHPVHAN